MPRVCDNSQIGANTRINGSAKARPKQSRRWCFTLNHYTEDEIAKLESVPVKYLIYGREIGDQGTPHLQGFIILNDNRALSWLKNNVSERAHWEAAKGNVEQNQEYCKKEGVWIEKGTVPQQGKRTDVDRAWEIVKEKGLSAAIDDNPSTFIRYPRGMKEYAQHLQMKKRRVKPKVFWFYGETGCGKTYEAYDKNVELYGYDDVWMSAETLQWFDGYEGQRVAVFDDFRKDFCKFHWLLRILDGRHCRVQVKGGHANFTPEIIYITAPMHPTQMYSDTEGKVREDINQLLRRIDKIEFFGARQCEVNENEI